MRGVLRDGQAERAACLRRIASGIEADFVLGDVQLVIEAKSGERSAWERRKGRRN